MYHWFRRYNKVRQEEPTFCWKVERLILGTLALLYYCISRLVKEVVHLVLQNTHFILCSTMYICCCRIYSIWPAKKKTFYLSMYNASILSTYYSWCFFLPDGPQFRTLMAGHHGGWKNESHVFKKKTFVQILFHKNIVLN